MQSTFDLSQISNKNPTLCTRLCTRGFGLHYYYSGILFRHLDILFIFKYENILKEVAKSIMHRRNIPKQIKGVEFQCKEIILSNFPYSKVHSNFNFSVNVDFHAFHPTKEYFQSFPSVLNFQLIQIYTEIMFLYLLLFLPLLIQNLK